MNGNANYSFDSCLDKQKSITALFKPCKTSEEKYQKIIELGKDLAPYPPIYKKPEYLVKGCQSIMYLHASLQEAKMHFAVYSEALISAGLAALLLSAYQEEPPEVILQCPPLFLEQINLHTALSPSRSNGLFSLLLHMKQKTLNFLIKK